MPYRLHARKRIAASGGLFDAPEPKPPQHWVAHVDGGARGNPGPAGYGVVIEDGAGGRVAEFCRFIGHATNNVAEYSGLIAAMEYALRGAARALKVYSDSELLVRQVNGIYKVKSPALMELHAKVKTLQRQFEWFRIEHVLRGKNKDADRLANEAMDEGMHRAASR
jgi:ribonuclease HI